MLEAFRTSIARSVKSNYRASIRFWSTVAAAAFAVGMAGASARAADETPYYHFKSILSTQDASWCIEVPDSKYEAGVQVLIGQCTGVCQASANQTFNESNGNLTIGGFCLAALNSSGKGAAAGDPVGLAECDGSDGQIWEVKPQTNSTGYQISNSSNLCVTLGGDVGAGQTLGLDECQDIETQGWELDVPSCRPSYGSYSEPVYYWYRGRRTCWYDDGWNG